MKKMRTILAMTAMFIISTVCAQMNPVEVTTTFNKISDTEAEIVFNANIQPTWHI